MFLPQRSSVPVGVSGDSDGTDIRSFYRSSIQLLHASLYSTVYATAATGLGGHRKKSSCPSSNLAYTPDRYDRPSKAKAFLHGVVSSHLLIALQQVLEVTYYIAILRIKRAGLKLYQRKGRRLHTNPRGYTAARASKRRYNLHKWEIGSVTFSESDYLSIYL